VIEHATVGIGNHETIPPKTREEFVLTFADWLNAPAIRFSADFVHHCYQDNAQN
jgi:hypothetical protein